MAVTFDTLKAATRLREEGGFSEKQATELVATFADGFVENLATKDDVEHLRGDVEKLEVSLRGDIDHLRGDVEHLRGDMEKTRNVAARRVEEGMRCEPIWKRPRHRCVATWRRWRCDTSKLEHRMTLRGEDAMGEMSKLAHPCCRRQTVLTPRAVVTASVSETGRCIDVVQRQPATPEELWAILREVSASQRETRPCECRQPTGKCRRPTSRCRRRAGKSRRPPANYAS